MKNFFERMQWKLIAFMQGRNGTDTLAQYALVGGIIFTFLELFTGLGLFSLIGLALLAYSMFRCFSRNIPARARENTRFLQSIAKPRAAWARARSHWQKRKTTKFLKCPQCKQSLSVPKGKGTLRITCPSCHTQFTTKS